MSDIQKFSDFAKERKHLIGDKVNLKDILDIPIDSQHIISSVMSHLGWLQHCNSYNFTNRHVTTDSMREIVSSASSNIGISNPLEKYNARINS